MAGGATSYDRPVLTRQRQDMMDEGLREQARESKREISFACDAIMYEQYVILYCNVGPTCRGPNSCVRTPLRYKREALAVHRTDPDRLKLSQPSHSRGKAIQHTVDVGYYAPAARTTLNPAVFIVFLSEIDLRLANPRVHTLWARAGAFHHPAVVSSTTTQRNTTSIRSPHPPIYLVTLKL